MTRLLIPFLILGACLLLAPRPASAPPITIDSVLVGNVGNAPDQLWPSNDPTNLHFGGVSHEYSIGTTEVPNAQYAASLNAKATTEQLGPYNTNMGGNARSGITRSGSEASGYSSQAQLFGNFGQDKMVNA